MRRVLSAIGVLSAVPVLLAVPVLSRPLASARPVVPHVADFAMAPTPATHGVIARAAVSHTGHYGLVGATWTGGRLPSGEQLQVRTQSMTRSGPTWSSWTDLTAPDGGPDDGSVDARAAAARHVTSTDPLWIGSADSVQARVVTGAGRSAAAPSGLKLVLVDGGSSAADSSPGAPRALGDVAEAAQAQPTIYTRAQWGADERLRSRNPGCGTPSYGSTIKLGYIHHTDTANGYSSSAVPSIIRSIYAYHVESNGWCDIGYNFLVDRFGRIWEGRYGGITKPVIGAHTGGFNTDTFGVSLIGNYTSTAPSSATVTAVERLFAWKLGSYYRNPLGKATTTAGSFSGSRFATGSSVTFNVVSGHRDADTTTCPGTAAYSKLGTIRTGIVKLMGAGFVAPTVSPASVRMLSGQTFAIFSGVIAAQTWTATVTAATGTVVKTLAGSASTSSPLTSVWDATGVDGLPVPPGTYAVTMTGANSAGQAAVPYSTKVTVTPPVTVTGPATTTYDAATPLSGTAAPNAAVTVTLQSAATGAAPVMQTVTAAANGTWHTTFVADNDYTWYVTSQGWPTTPQLHTTRIAPSVSAPLGSVGRNVFTAPGSTIALSGTALPGTTVTGPSGLSVPVDTTGQWTGLSVAPTTATTVIVKDARGLTSVPLTVYPVGQPTATAPATGYSARSFSVTGNAGSAPLSVQLWTEPPGATSYTLVKTVTAAASGVYSVAATLPTVTASTPMAWRVVTTAAGTTFGTVNGSVSVLPTFVPTIAGPTLGSYGGTVKLSGKAVPGDTVTLWTRPLSGGSWARTATTRATGGSAWAASYVLRRDTSWRVTSLSGTSSTGNTRVRPTLHVPATAAKGATINGWGYAAPGQKVAVYRRPLGTTTWRYVGTVTASTTGRWSGHWHLIYPMNVQVHSNHVVSPVATIRYS